MTFRPCFQPASLTPHPAPLHNNNKIIKDEELTCRSEKRCSSIVASFKHKLFCSRYCCYFAIKHSTIQSNTLHYFSRPGELPSVALYCCIIMGRNSRFSQVCRFLSGRKKPVASFSFKFTLRSSISGRARFYISS